MNAGAVLGLMAALFLVLGYMRRAGLVRADRWRHRLDTMFTPMTHAVDGRAASFNGIDSEALLAVPFFLLVGELMASAKVVRADRSRLSQTLVGHMRGGLAQVVTLFSMFFSGMSGSVDGRRRGAGAKHRGQADGQGGLRAAAFTAALIASASTIANLDPAEHHGSGLRRGRQRPRSAGLFLDWRRARLHDRHRPDGLQLLLGPGRRQEEARYACGGGDAARGPALPLVIPAGIISNT